MACFTCTAELPLVKIVVTVRTSRINGAIMTILVATSARYKLMAPRELKLATTMIKNRNLPKLECFVAVITASFLKLLTVYIGVTVTAVALRIILQLCAIGMAPIAALLKMLPFECKTGP